MDASMEWVHLGASQPRPLHRPHFHAPDGEGSTTMSRNLWRCSPRPPPLSSRHRRSTISFV